MRTERDAADHMGAHPPDMISPVRRSDGSTVLLAAFRCLKASRSAFGHHPTVVRAAARWRMARGPATRSSAGSRTSTSSPQDRIQSRISMTPLTVDRQISPPSSARSVCWRGCHVVSSNAVGDRRREAQDDLGRRLVRDDVPAAAQVALERRALRRLEAPRRDPDLPDALDLERPHRVAVLVPADEVQRVRLERRLDQERAHGPLRALARPALVRRALVDDLDDPPVRPGTRQLADVVDEVRVEGRVLQDVEAPAPRGRAASRAASAASFSNAEARSGSYLSA